MSATITRLGPLDMQVCVLVCWTDAEIREFAERENPCGTEAGWLMRRESDAALAGMPGRNPCNERERYVHVMLDA